MRKKLCKYAAVFAIVTISAAMLIAFSSCEEKSRDNEYFIKIAIGDSFEEVECSVVMRITPDHDEESLRLLMHANAFSERLPAEKADINAAYPKGESYGKVEINSATADGEAVEYSLSGSVLALNSSVKRGRRREIAINYKLRMPYNTLRYGYNSYSLNLAQFYPQYAPIAEYGIIGDPFNSYPDNYTVEITCPERFKALASGDLTEESAVGNGMKRMRFTAEKCRDYSAVIGANYDEMHREINGIRINYIYFTDKTPEQSLNRAADAVIKFGELFHPYERKTLNIAETNFLYGGMEYSGLVTVTNAAQGPERERIIVHEIGHQWWYDAVHSDQTEHAWQDEGLTEFSVYLYYLAAGEEEAARKLLWNAKTSVEAYRAMVTRIGLAVDERIDRKSEDFSSGDEYTFSVYIKGQLMFNYIYETLGRDKFLHALQAYYKDNRFKNMTGPDKLLEKFEKELPGISIVIQAWLNGKIYSL